MTPGPLALGVDLGTSSVRAFLFDVAGRRQGGVRLPYHWKLTQGGGVELEPEAAVQLVVRAVDGALDAAGGGVERIRAVGVSALWHTLMGVDPAGSPLTPAYGWGDTRATDAARALRERLDERAVHGRTGAMLHPSYPVARLAWLRAADPARFGAVHRWLSLPEYVWLRLTGASGVDVSIAAGSGLLDQGTLAWDDALLDVLGVAAGQLSPVALAAGCSLRRPGGIAAGRWPALRDAVWRMPVGDGACANIGSGCLSAERMALSVGTSAAVRTLLRDPCTAPPPAGLWRYRLDSEHALLGAATSNGGVVRQWLRSTVRVSDDDAELDAQLAARPPAAHGLSVLPFLAGERSPHWPLDASGVVSGVRLGTTPLDLLQAGMEAVAYRIALLRRLILAARPESRTVVASGASVARSVYWPQLLADALGEDILLSDEPEASSRGAALLALVAAGELSAVEDAPVPGARLVSPDPESRAAHARALERQVRLAAATDSGAL